MIVHLNSVMSYSALPISDMYKKEATVSSSQAPTFDQKLTNEVGHHEDLEIRRHKGLLLSYWYVYHQSGTEPGVDYWGLGEAIKMSWKDTYKEGIYKDELERQTQ